MNGLWKLGLVAVIGALLALLGYSLLLRPQLDQLSVRRMELKLQRAELTLLEHQVTAYTNAQNDLLRVARKDEILRLFRPKEELVPAVVGLEQAAAVTSTEHDLQINEPDPTDTSPNPVEPVLNNLVGVTEIPYRVTTRNDYGGTIAFLQYLEHLPQLTEIYQINLSAETIDSETSDDKIYTGRVFGSIDGVFFINPSPE